MLFKARYFDGKSAASTPVDIKIDDTGLILKIANGDAILERWPGPSISVVFQSANGARVDVASSTAPDARLMIEGEGIQEVLSPYLPSLTQTPKAEWGVGLRISAYLLVGAVVFFLVLSLFAEAIVLNFPASWERELGRTLAEGTTMETFIGGDICEAPEGKRALDKMVNRLSEGYNLRHPLQVAVIDSQDVNAYALPGGYIRVLSGLLETADHPDSVAGIIAHEIGHVEERHSLKIMARSLLIVAALESVTGGTGFSAIFIDLSNLRYGRELEEEADDFAIARMKAVGLDPGDLAHFFDLLEKKGLAGGSSSVDELFSTHPLTHERSDKFMAVAAPRSAPSLTPDEWQDLKGICGASQN